MTRVCDAAQEPNIIRIAAKATLLMIGKYYALTDDNEVYRIAIGGIHLLFIFGANELSKAMCPEKKVEWFDQNPDWHPEDRAEARRIIQNRWEESYSSVSQPSIIATSRDKDGQPKVRIAHLNQVVTKFHTAKAFQMGNTR